MPTFIVTFYWIVAIYFFGFVTGIDYCMTVKPQVRLFISNLVFSILWPVWAIATLWNITLQMWEKPTDGN